MPDETQEAPATEAPVEAAPVEETPVEAPAETPAPEETETPDEEVVAPEGDAPIVDISAAANTSSAYTTSMSWGNTGLSTNVPFRNQ